MSPDSPSVIPAQLKADADAINGALARCFDELRQHSIPPPSRLIEVMSYGALAGGKRLRGAIVLAAARLAAQGREPAGAIRAAAAFEVIHAYSLIHDDLPAMDDAETRRGQPSCHIQFGEAAAILAGDALQSMAFELLADRRTHDNAEVRVGLVSDLAVAAGVVGMAGGQMLDLDAETSRFSLDDIRTMQALKTGALIRAAAVAGGRIGGGEDNLLAALRCYANKLGRAFQITDDLLDRNSDAAAMGKPTGRDDRAGKASVAALMGEAKAEIEAERLIDEANQILIDAVGFSAPNIDYMIEISNFVVRRNH
jgi:farnesyl diphosphate synthase